MQRDNNEDSDGDRRWAVYLNAVREYVSAHSTLPPADHVINNMMIGRWVERQRDMQKNSSLHADRVRTLETLPGWFWHH
jgi:hypothetical protein